MQTPHRQPPFIVDLLKTPQVLKSKLQLDKQALKRLEDISKLPEENKNFVLNLIDMALRDFKVKKAHAS